MAFLGYITQQWMGIQIFTPGFSSDSEMLDEYWSLTSSAQFDLKVTDHLILVVPSGTTLPSASASPLSLLIHSV